MKQFKKIILIYSLLLNLPNLFSQGLFNFRNFFSSNEAGKQQTEPVSFEMSENANIKLMQIGEPIEVRSVDDAKKFIAKQLSEKEKKQIKENDINLIPQYDLEEPTVNPKKNNLSIIESPSHNSKTISSPSYRDLYIQKKQDSGSWINKNGYYFGYAINLLTWSPDGKTLVAVGRGGWMAKGSSEEVLFKFWELQDNDSLLDKKEDFKLKSPFGYGTCSVNFSPNGNLLAFADKKQLFIFKKDSAGKWNQLAKTDINEPSRDKCNYVIWNSDGTKIYVAHLEYKDRGKFEVLGGKIYTFSLEKAWKKEKNETI